MECQFWGVQKKIERQWAIFIFRIFFLTELDLEHMTFQASSCERLYIPSHFLEHMKSCFNFHGILQNIFQVQKFPILCSLLAAFFLSKEVFFSYVHLHLLIFKWNLMHFSMLWARSKQLCWSDIRPLKSLPAGF